MTYKEFASQINIEVDDPPNDCDMSREITIEDCIYLFNSLGRLIRHLLERSSWHTGEPTRTDCLYLVLWFDTEDKAYQYSVLNWHDQLHCWFDEETPSCLWGDEWKAKVVAWMAFKPYKEKEK